ncbi:MAG: PIN domain-containing protein [Syntrophomonadaceae bacterium]|jgi:predicted nucleic-acid-binding protein
MIDVWVDANVMLRYLLRDNEDLFSQAESLIKSAEAGEIRIRLASLTVAEMVWVMDSFYNLDRDRLVEILTTLITADGVVTDEKELMLKALVDYHANNVDFIDAYLANRADSLGDPVATFDNKHFKRLPAKLYFQQLTKETKNT